MSSASSWIRTGDVEGAAVIEKVPTCQPSRNSPNPRDAALPGGAVHVRDHPRDHRQIGPGATALRRGTVPVRRRGGGDRILRAHVRRPAPRWRGCPDRSRSPRLRICLVHLGVPVASRWYRRDRSSRPCGDHRAAAVRVALRADRGVRCEQQDPQQARQRNLVRLHHDRQPRSTAARRWRGLLRTLRIVLDAHGVELLPTAPLLAPAPDEIRIPTAFDGPHAVFDTLFYWED